METIHMLICQHCKNTFPNSILINGKRLNLNRRKYCLDCSPYNGHNTRPIGLVKIVNCKLCNKELKPRCYSYCNNCNIKIRRGRRKLAAIHLLGGKCQRCGWKENPFVLEFHHKDDNKEFSISNNINRAWDVIKKEVLKCELLCANCHRAHHCTTHNIQFYDIMKKYNGELELDTQFMLR